MNDWVYAGLVFAMMPILVWILWLLLEELGQKR